MVFSCKNCNKNYKSRMGLFRHNKECNVEISNKKPNNICKYCNKLLSNYTSKWRHEQNCSLNSNKFIQKMENMQKEIKDLKSKISSNPQTINNKMTNSNNTQNIICVFPFSKEPNNVLSIKYLTKSLNELGINSVIDIVKKKHFNPELPQLHNFCVTAKNDNYASIVDPETKKIKYVNKKDVFDSVYAGVVSNVNKIEKPNVELKETINKINNIPVSKNMLKKLHSGINEEAYHHRDLVKKTWTNAYFDENKINIDLNDSDDDNEIDSNAPIIDKIEHLLNEIKRKSYLFM